MFIPIGHDVDGLKRWPVVTFGIIAICTAVLAATSFEPRRDSDVTAERFQAAAEYYLEHPELDAHPELQRWLETAIALQDDPEVQEDLQDRLDAEAEATPLQDVRQTKLDELTAAWLATLRQGPVARWGLVPNAVVPERVFTHMWVHDGFLHLLFNMLFLYLAGPLLEDVWGRPFFGVFYVLAGVVPALLFVRQYPDLAIPLVGASGAVAGVLGAMLARHPQTRIRLLWLWGLVARQFSTPAWVVLPVWVGSELLWAYVMDAVAPGSGGGGVAHWVHVYGFGFGLVVAAIVNGLGLERLVGPRDPHDADHAVLRKVERALAREHREEAWSLLRGHVAREPGDRDAALAYWDLAKAIGRCRDAAPVLVRVMRAELAAGEREAMLAHWTDLHTTLPDVVVETDLAARVALALGDAGARVEAADLVRGALARVEVTTPAAALVELVRAARYAEEAVAREVTARALAHPGLPPSLRRELVGQG